MAKPRRIAFLGPAHPYRGGIAQFMEATVRGMAARGHKTRVFTFTRQYPGLFFPGKSQVVTTPVEDPLETERTLDTINPLTWLKTARAINEFGPHILVPKYWMPFFAPSYGSIARSVRKRGTKVVAVVHNALPHERRIGDVPLSKYFFGACDGLVTMSEAVESDIRGFGIDLPTRRIAHPIYDVYGEAPDRETARRKLGLDDGDPVLLFFGFIRQYKGLQVLLDAMPRIVEVLPQAKLVVAGEFYDDAGPYIKSIERMGISEAVRLHTNYIPNGEVARYFAAADVVVQPYVTATQSGVAQIAFHFERPLIVTAVGGLPEIVPHERAGLVVPPSDPGALAGSVIRFFRENLAGPLTEGVRDEKPKYSWDWLYKAIEELGA